LEPEYGPKDCSPAKAIAEPKNKRKTAAIKAYIVLFIFLPPFSPTLGREEKKDMKETECGATVLLRQIAIKRIISSPTMRVPFLTARGSPIFDQGRTRSSRNALPIAGSGVCEVRRSFRI
jgi:hypothetical protein